MGRKINRIASAAYSRRPRGCRAFSRTGPVPCRCEAARARGHLQSSLSLPTPSPRANRPRGASKAALAFWCSAAQLATSKMRAAFPPLVCCSRQAMSLMLIRLRRSLRHHALHRCLPALQAHLRRHSCIDEAGELFVNRAQLLVVEQRWVDCSSACQRRS